MTQEQQLNSHYITNTKSNNTKTIRRAEEESGSKEGERRWLLCNREYQSLICAFHGYAVRIHHLEGHLRDRHPDLGHEVRGDAIRHYKGLLLTLPAEGPGEDQLAGYGPSNPAEPVEGLGCRPNPTNRAWLLLKSG
jgi:hypothetical protein